MTKCAHAAADGTAEPVPIRLGRRAPSALAPLELGELAEIVFDALPFFFMLVDARHTILFANRAVREALGKSAAELLGAYCPTVIHGLAHPFPGCPLEQAATDGATVETDFYEPTARAWVNSAIYPTTIRTADGVPVYAHVVRDVSKRHFAQAEVRERAAVEQLSARLATHFLAATPDPEQDALGEVLRMLADFMGCSRYAEYRAGERADRLELVSSWQDPASQVVLSELPTSLPLEQVIAATRKVGEPNAMRFDPPLPQGPESEHSVSIPISVGGGAINGCIRFDQWARAKGPRLEDSHLSKLLGSTLSIGIERLRAARQLALHAERLRSMALELTAAEERERRRIAVDLHDQIGQTLALSLMKVSSLRAQAASPETGRALDELFGHSEAALSDAKSLMFRLSPPVLHQFGLGAALEWLLEQCETRRGLSWTLRDESGGGRLGEDREMFLFRATQELVANVERHARASRIEVSLSSTDRDIEVCVADDGVGFPANPKRGFGLFSIEERLAQLGGGLEVTPRPGGGTRVTLRLRLERAEEGAAQ